MATLQRLALRGTPKATKQAARYTPAGGAERCGMCRHYVPSSSCARIEGPVSAAGWCQLYSQQVTWRPRAGQLAGLNPGLVPTGVTLDLSFMAPGTMPQGVAFTRASTATYFDATGTLQTATTNAPRWDYDPVTHALRGLLIEEARTNVAWPSVPVVGARWAISGPATLGGTVTVPDGTTATTSLVAATDTTNALRQLGLTSTAVTASTVYTITAFLKQSAASNGYIQFNNNGAAAASVAYFNLASGTAIVGADLVPGMTGLSASIAPLPNGWYRAAVTFTTTAAANSFTCFIGPCTTVSSTGDNRSAVGVVGQGIYAWGVQLEAGAFPTSYIPTTAASVTRAIDVCGIAPGNMGFFVSPGGSWAADFINLNPSLSGNRRVVGYPLGGQVAPLYVSAAANVLEQWSGGPVLSTVNAVVTGAISKGSSTFAVGAASICLNGGAVASSGALTGGYSSLATNGVGFLTTGAGNTESMSGYIRRVRYWPRVLTNAELQSVTT